MTTATLTNRQSEIASLLDRRGPMKVSEIAKEIGADRGSTREMLMALNGKNLVKRYRSEAGVRWGRR